MKQQEEIDFGTEKVSKLFKKLFFPTLLGMLGISAMTAIDGIFIGHSVGSDGIAAVNIVVPVLMLLTGIGLMVGSGCSVAASIHLAQGRTKVARLNVTQALIAVSAVGIVVIAAMLAEPEATARFLGSSEHLLPLVKEYMVWYVPSWIFLLWESVLLFVIRLDGAPKVAMASSMVAAVLNILLDYLFMFPLGWGLMGAAFATSISTAAGTAVAAAYLLGKARHLRLIPLKPSRKSLKLSLRNLGYQCRIGSSALLAETTLAVLMFTGNQVFMRYLGDNGVGAFGIACYYAPFIFMVGNAIAQSAQPILSYNYGIGAYGRMRETERAALLAAAICGIATTLIFLLFPKSLVGLFIDLDNPAARIAVEGLPFFACGFAGFVFNITAIGYFQSVERMRPATIFALLRGAVLLVPAFWLLPLVAGTKGIWLSMPVAEILTALSIMAFYRWGGAYRKREPHSVPEKSPRKAG